ncbi:MAG: MauE/DoxX family redox-associated membrane protein [Phycisphaerae bacterium]
MTGTIAQSPKAARTLPEFGPGSSFSAVTNMPRKRAVAPMVMRLVGMLLLAAAALKAWQYIRSPIQAPQPLWSPKFDPVLICTETFLGLWLIGGAFPSIARRAAISVFGIFASYAAYEAVLGRDSCGCFGNVGLNPWLTVMIDTTVLAALFSLARPAAMLRTRRSSGYTVALSSGIALMAGVTAAVLHPRAAAAANGLVIADHGRLIILEPRKWIGQHLPILGNILAQSGSKPLAEKLAAGQWVVLFYHASCGECQKTIPIYQRAAEQWKAADRLLRMAFIRVPSNIGKETSGAPVGNGPMAWGILDASHQWFATTPAAVELKDGTVIKAAADTAAMKLNWLN